MGSPTSCSAPGRTATWRSLLGNGDGSLRAPTLFALQGSPEDLAIGDFDLDGRLDVAVALTMNAAPACRRHPARRRRRRADGLGLAVVLAAAAAGGRGRLRRRRSARSRHRRRPRLRGQGVHRARKRRRHVRAAAGARGHAARAPRSRWRSTTSTATADSTSRSDATASRATTSCCCAATAPAPSRPPTGEPVSDSCGALPRLVVSEQTGDDLLEVLALDDTGVTSYLGLGWLRVRAPARDRDAGRAGRHPGSRPRRTYPTSSTAADPLRGSRSSSATAMARSAASRPSPPACIVVSTRRRRSRRRRQCRPGDRVVGRWSLLYAAAATARWRRRSCYRSPAP